MKKVGFLLMNNGEHRNSGNGKDILAAAAFCQLSIEELWHRWIVALRPGDVLFVYRWAEGEQYTMEVTRD